MVEIRRNFWPEEKTSLTLRKESSNLTGGSRGQISVGGNGSGGFLDTERKGSDSKSEKMITKREPIREFQTTAGGCQSTSGRVFEIFRSGIVKGREVRTVRDRGKEGGIAKNQVQGAE